MTVASTVSHCCTSATLAITTDTNIQLSNVNYEVVNFQKLELNFELALFKCELS